MADCNLEGDKCLLHIIVIGFHHKKGCQVGIAFLYSNSFTLSLTIFVTHPDLNSTDNNNPRLYLYV